MTKKIIAVAGMLISLMTASAMAQTPAAPTASLPQPVQIGFELMKVQITDKMTLDAVLEKLKATYPDFNSVIQRDGVDAAYPILPNIKTDNISIDQFMDFLKAAYPGISIDPLEGPAGVLYLVQIKKVDQQQPPGIVPAGFVAQPQQPDPNIPQVVICSLGSEIDKLKEDKDDKYTTKQAMDDLLSLVQAAMKAQADPAPADIQIHEATQTLVFRGNVQQIILLNQVLTSFDPSQDDVSKQLRAKDDEIQRTHDQLNRSIEEAQEQIIVARDENKDLRQKLADAEQQITLLQAKLQAFTGPDTKK